MKDRKYNVGNPFTTVELLDVGRVEELLLHTVDDVVTSNFRLREAKNEIRENSEKIPRNFWKNKKPTEKQEGWASSQLGRESRVPFQCDLPRGYTCSVRYSKLSRNQKIS